ncbi:zinc-dependent alcohol dehydrogenase family protein [Streptomyces sp. NPDC127105]|uniref:zinc-dependent alcohol dehydrogenase family protein n=1 Tax=Streptomyces sp. NPDC127105 TaxID=3345359 RepID=UPI003645FB50
MRGAVLYAPGDVRFEERADPGIENPTDAVIRTVATCVCGSDLWDYRGINPVEQPAPFGHEYVGIVEEVGGDVKNVEVGQFVVGSFFASDNTCPNCRNGYQTNCLHREFVGAGGCQAERIRIPLADGTLVATPEVPDQTYVPSLLACSDVMGTGWYAAKAAEVGPGDTVAVVGDGAVGLCAVIAARELGAERIIAMSRHEPRQRLAREFGATDVVAERGEEGLARIKEMTGGIGADRVLECVGNEQSMQQALNSTRPGGNVGFVGVPHGVSLDGAQLFYSQVGVRGGPAPVRAYLPDLIDRVLTRRIDPGKVFDLKLPLSEVAEGYKAMDERRAIKTLLMP